MIKKWPLFQASDWHFSCPMDIFQVSHRIIHRTLPQLKWSALLASACFERVKVAQSCLTVCNPMECTVHGILQARILEWVAVSFSRGSSQARDQTWVSHIAGGFFTNWVIREAWFCLLCLYQNTIMFLTLLFLLGHLWNCPLLTHIAKWLLHLLSFISQISFPLSAHFLHSVPEYSTSCNWPYMTVAPRLLVFWPIILKEKSFKDKYMIANF